MATSPKAETLIGELVPDERERARAFVNDVDRHRFAAGRAALRRILSYYLGIPPIELQLGTTENGKPSLNESVAHGVEFNVTGSHEVVLIAVSRCGRVGVDVEQLAPLPELDRLIRHVFSPQEQAAFRRLAEPDRTEAFYRVWTRKEAYLKAIGAGLSMPMTQITVTIEPGASPQILLDGDPDVGPWSLQTLDLNPNYAAALAVEVVDPIVSRRELGWE